MLRHFVKSRSFSTLVQRIKEKPAPQLVTIKINGREKQVEAGRAIIEVCEGDEKLTRYCYNERLGISGNCRMCMVEVKGVKKPVIGCVEKVREGLEINTKIGGIAKSKEGVMELMLKNHPLDCPICDQGGECDLQEGSLSVGTDRSRDFKITRREIRKKNIGRLIKTEMQRCITCSRCVRYEKEIKGEENLGMLGRSEYSEITVFTETIREGVIGNVIDLCPVGKIRIPSA